MSNFQGDNKYSHKNVLTHQRVKLTFMQGIEENCQAPCLLKTRETYMPSTKKKLNHGPLHCVFSLRSIHFFCRKKPTVG